MSWERDGRRTGRGALLAGVAAAGCVAALASCAAPRAGHPAAVEAADRLPAGVDRPAALPPGGLRLSVEEAVLLGLERNTALRVERFGPALQRLREEEERARFDPRLTAGGGAGRETAAGGAAAERREAEAELSQRFVTGTVLGVDAGWRRDELEGGASGGHRVRAGISATQPLLQGGGRAANRAALEQAAIETRISDFELRGFAEALAAEVELACWDHALAARRIEIVRESAALAEQQLSEIERRIEVGTLAETERAAARAEVALRREALINAESQAGAARLRLLRMLDPDGDWDRDLDILDEPMPPDPATPAEDTAARVARAIERRPELAQARLALERGDLEIVRTRNGLLPRLDLFIRLGRTGYAESFDAAADPGDARDDWSTGLRLEAPLGRRAERARHARAVFSRDRAETALRNLEQLVVLDVRLGGLELARAAEQIRATEATRVLREEAMRAEMEKLRVGRSTALQVAQAQRDVMAGRLAEAEAATQYWKARVRLERLDGSLLERRGFSLWPVEAPGPGRP